MSCFEQVSNKASAEDREIVELDSRYLATFSLGGKKWPSVEHYLQAAKFPSLPTLRRCIRKAPSCDGPRGCVALGQKNEASVRSDWELFKVDLLYAATSAKFGAHEALRVKLCGTRRHRLRVHTPPKAVEASRRGAAALAGVGVWQEVVLERIREELRATSDRDFPALEVRIKLMEAHRAFANAAANDAFASSSTLCASNAKSAAAAAATTTATRTSPSALPPPRSLQFERALLALEAAAVRREPPLPVPRYGVVVAGFQTPGQSMRVDGNWWVDPLEPWVNGEPHLMAEGGGHLFLGKDDGEGEGGEGGTACTRWVFDDELDPSEPCGRLYLADTFLVAAAGAPGPAAAAAAARGKLPFPPSSSPPPEEVPLPPRLPLGTHRWASPSGGGVTALTMMPITTGRDHRLGPRPAPQPPPEPKTTRHTPPERREGRRLRVRSEAEPSPQPLQLQQQNQQQQRQQRQQRQQQDIVSLPSMQPRRASPAGRLDKGAGGPAPFLVGGGAKGSIRVATTVVPTATAAAPPKTLERDGVRGESCRDRSRDSGRDSGASCPAIEWVVFLECAFKTGWESGPLLPNMQRVAEAAESAHAAAQAAAQATIEAAQAAEAATEAAAEAATSAFPGMLPRAAVGGGGGGGGGFGGRPASANAATAADMAKAARAARAATAASTDPGLGMRGAGRFPLLVVLSARSKGESPLRLAHSLRSLRSRQRRVPAPALLGCVVHGETPDLRAERDPRGERRRGRRRAAEVVAWLAAHPPPPGTRRRWVAVDDHDLIALASKAKSKATRAAAALVGPRFVQINPNEGFTEGTADRVISMLI